MTDLSSNSKPQLNDGTPTGGGQSAASKPLGHPKQKDTVIYGRHFVTKPPVMFYSQEKKMVINILWSGISIQGVPSTSSNLEIIKYRNIQSVQIGSEKENEIVIQYSNRQVAAGKNPQAQHIFKSEDRHHFLSDFYQGYDKYCEYHQIKQPQTTIILGPQYGCQNFQSINASYIFDKSTKSYFEATLTCYHSHLTIAFQTPLTLNSDKLKAIVKSSYYQSTSKMKQKEEPVLLKEENDDSQIAAALITPQIENSSHEVIIVKYRDILRIQKKSNGFQLNLSRPNLSHSFYLNDLNTVNGFIYKIQKNSKDSTKLDVSVISAHQEEIHNMTKFKESEMEVDFSIYSERVIFSKTHTRVCILAIGKTGILEIDPFDAEVYETLDLRYLKDIVRQEQVGGVRNSLKLVFANCVEVEYVFKPFQRDLFIVEILTNINMYYDNFAYCRRCLDTMHSRTPNYSLEIYGWKMDSGYPDRDNDLDLELMRNINSAKNEESFFSALREFNVNCHLKKLLDSDILIYKQLLSTAMKYLAVCDDPDLSYFIKHFKIVKSIPFSQLSIMQAQVNALINPHALDPIHLYQKEMLFTLEKDAINRFIDEEYSSQQEHLDHEFSDLASEYQAFNDQEDYFECFSPKVDREGDMTSDQKKKRHDMTIKNITPIPISEELKPLINPLVNEFELGQSDTNAAEKVEIRIRANKDLEKLFKLCSHSEFTWQEEELMRQMRVKSIHMLKRMKKSFVTYGKEGVLKLDSENVESHMVKIEEILKCLTIFQNCKRFFEDKSIKMDRLKEFKCILQLLSSPDPLIVYQTSQLFKKIGFYHNNMMQKAETDNKNFLLDSQFNILDRVFYQISNYTLIKRPLSQSTFMIRIYSCLSIINTLFQARIESTSQIHRQAIISHLQSPVFFAVINRILRYNSFSLIVNSISLLNALYFFSTENKSFINMILLNSTILLYLLHLVIQNTHSSKQLKEISFNLLFSLLNQRSQACFVVMNVFPKQLFKKQKTESLFVDQWTKLEWQKFFFSEIQEDINTALYYWQKSNLKHLDEALLKEDKGFLQQQIYSLFKRISHASDLQQFFPQIFSKFSESTSKESKSPMSSSKKNLPSGSHENSSTQLNESESELQNSIKDLQKEIFTKVYWNIDDFKVDYQNVQDQFLCGRYYLKNLLSDNCRLVVEFVDKNQYMEKELKELWESLVLNLMNKQEKEKQFLVLKAMTVLYKEYSRVLKFTNILPYLIHILNLREFETLQYSIIQLILTVLNSDDAQSKQYHCRLLIDNNGIQQLLLVIYSRISLSENLTPVSFGINATLLKLTEAKTKSDENLFVLYMAIKIISGCIQMHTHVYRKREVFPETKPQKICLEQKNQRILMNILLMKNDSCSNGNQPQSIVRCEYLKLLFEYLLADSLLRVPGFCELLIDQINENSAEYSFAIIKALFYRLNDSKQILTEIIDGNGLQQRHITAFPFFKFFPSQFLIILLSTDADEPYHFFRQSQKKVQEINSQSHSSLQVQGATNLKDQNVQATVKNFKTDKKESYELIWKKEMQVLLKEKTGILLAPLRSSVDQFHSIIWTRPKPGLTSYAGIPDQFAHLAWDYRIMSEEAKDLFPVADTNISIEVLKYPQLKNEMVVNQIYLRYWAKYPDINYHHLPYKFAANTILKIQQYSYQPDIFKVVNSKTSSAMKNLLFLIKSQTKVYKLKIPLSIEYPYSHLMNILGVCVEIVKNNIEDPENVCEIDENELDDNEPHSPLQNQPKRNNTIRRASTKEIGGQKNRKNSVHTPRKGSVNSSTCSELDLSFSTPLVHTLESTFNQYIKAVLKLIYHSFSDQKNMDTFCSKKGGIEYLIVVLTNVSLQIQIKDINRQSDIRYYFEDVSVSYSEIKIITYAIKILQKIFNNKKQAMLLLSQTQRNDLCLLLQKFQKISIAFFHIFLEKSTGLSGKEKYGNSLAPPSKQRDKTPRNAEQTTPSNQTGQVQLTHNQLLEKLFNIDSSNILSTSDSAVEKCFDACRALNVVLSQFTLSIANTTFFLESMIRGGCIWRSLELILVKGKPFNQLQNHQKQKNIANLDSISAILAEVLFRIIKNCEQLNRFEQKKLVMEKAEEEISETKTEDKAGEVILQSGGDESTVFSSSNSAAKIQLNERTEQKEKKQPIYFESKISEEDQSRSDARSSEISSFIRTNEYQAGDQKDQYHNHLQTIESEISMSSPNKKTRSEEKQKEAAALNSQFIENLGQSGIEKLLFFTKQLSIALTRSVDSHLMKYILEEQYDEFTRKINSNVEFPDFIWNEISRSNLDLNLKLQIINVNLSSGKIFLDKLLEHQGIIQIDDQLQASPSKRVNGEGANKGVDQKPELQISGIYLRVFNESDNFEVTNPQTFQQEIFKQLKINIKEIEDIIASEELVLNYDSLAMNLAFESQFQAVKECLKATLSLLTRYSVQYIVLSAENIETLFKTIKMELCGKVNLSSVKLQISKIFNELSGSVQGAETLICSNIYLKYIITNLKDCNTLSSQIVQQKLARIRSNLDLMISKRILSVLLFNTLRKEYLKQGIRVQIVEVINEINTDCQQFTDFIQKKVPARIYQKLFANKNQTSSIEIIEALDAATFQSDLLWTNLMRIELISVLEQEVLEYLQSEEEDFSAKDIIPFYPELRNEIECCQIVLRIYNLTPSYTKFSEMNNLCSLLNQEGQSFTFFSDLLLSNLISQCTQYLSRFIYLQKESLAKNKEFISKFSESDNNDLASNNLSENSLRDFDRVSTSYITALTSLMFCLEHIIISEKRQISEEMISHIFTHFEILSENKSHSHLKSTIIQIAYLLKDVPRINDLFLKSQFFKHVSTALNYSLDKPLESESISSIEQVAILNLLIKIVRDKDDSRQVIIEQNMTYCLPVIAHLLETITEDSLVLKSYIIAYCAELLRSGFFFEEISAIIDQTTFSAKQLTASKSTHCEWVNLWRACIMNYDESNCLSEVQQRQLDEIIYDSFFQLPIQSEFSVQTLSFPPSQYLQRLQEIEEFKGIYEKELVLKKEQNSNVMDSVNLNLQGSSNNNGS